MNYLLQDPLLSSQTPSSKQIFRTPSEESTAISLHQRLIHSGLGLCKACGLVLYLLLPNAQPKLPIYFHHQIIRLILQFTFRATQPAKFIYI